MIESIYCCLFNQAIKYGRMSFLVETLHVSGVCHGDDDIGSGRMS